MRLRFLPALTFTLAVIGSGSGFARPASAFEPSPDGNWKVVVLAFGEDEFAVVRLADKDGKPSATLLDGQRAFRITGVKDAEVKDGTVKLTLTGLAGDCPFSGTLVKDGPEAGRYLGTIRFQGYVYPARLETTKETKAAQLQRSPLLAKIREIMGEKDAKAKIKKLEEAIASTKGSPNSSAFYTELLNSAETAGLDASKVGDIIAKWTSDSKAYGKEWTNEVKLKALKSISTGKNFAKMTVDLAREIDKGISEETLEPKADLLGLLAKAAKASGMTELATETESRLTKINDKLDEDYHHKVPPFKPATFAGRKGSSADRVVLMELFTGAQCPPCVAADVAFDALLTTYKPTEFIGLQYHLHIPGPDPMTNRDALARQEYYGSDVQGTPSTFFNGHSEAGGGGPMANANGKYTEFREIIEKALAEKKRASIDVSASRSGDKVKIVASAKADPKGGEKPKGEKSEPKLFLRLALTEESVRYVGGNKLRFHHHVVRAYPGGVEGKELKDGEGKVELTLNLAEVKQKLDDYVTDFGKTNKFHTTPPEFNFDHLALVAFVQDDSDKSVLHAVSVPLEQARP